MSLNDGLPVSAQWQTLISLATRSGSRVLAMVALGITLAAANEMKPQFGAWGYDAAGADFSTKAGNDFFRYVNGGWLDKTEIPADKPGVSLRLAMTDLIEERLRNIMEQTSPADLEGKVGAFYRAFMDEALVDALGAKPLGPDLASVRDATTRDRLAALMGLSNSDFVGSLFNISIDADLKNPNHYAVYVGQAGLGLPDRDYYLKDDFAAVMAKYEMYIAKLLHLANWPGSPAKDVVAFETKIAEASWTKAEQRDAIATYNLTTVEELQKFAPGFGWRLFLDSAQLENVTRLIVAEKSAFPKIAAIFAATPIETMQAWQAFHIVDNAAPFLSRDFADAHFEMRDKTLSGQQEQKARWKRAVVAVGGGDFLVGDRFGTFGTLGFGVGQMYTAKYFPPDSKIRIEALVANLKAAYRVRLQNLDWMSEVTRSEALKKLDTYTIKVGYPDRPRDYSKMTILADDLVGNVRRAGAADWTFYRGRLFGPVDRSDWIMTPQTNDAYNGSLRDIVFPAGILQAPLFDAAADPAVNYGAIGGIIGHELTHGFDDQGRKIDADGVLRDWWAAGDAQKFETRAKALGEQYSNFEPLPGVHVDGALTMGENIADLGGLTLALDAYHASLHGQPAPVIDGFSGDQRVLLGWAQAWRGRFSDAFLRKQVVSDPHSPRQFRVNGVVRNVDLWYTAFGVEPGDKLYVPSLLRVRIW